MKKYLLVVVFFALIAASLVAERAITLDEALSVSAKGISSKLPEGTKAVIVEIKADDDRASEYIADELTLKIFDTGTVVMVDRQNIDKIRQELSFQTSGDVSDESAQRLGAMLGAETLITGSFELVHGFYRLTIKAVKVETAEIQYLSSLSVIKDANTEALFGRGSAGKEVAKKVGTKAVSAAKGLAGFSGRLVCSVINPIVGIGSFMQGDVKGGSRVAFWEVVGVGAMSYGGYRESHDQSNGNILEGTGGFVLGAAIVYSIVRPWIYNRAPQVTAVFDKVDISYTAHRDRGESIVNVGYVLRY